MKDFLVLVNGGWYLTEIRDIKKGQSFKVDLPQPPVGQDNNPRGDDIYVASRDAMQVDGNWVVEIEKPAQTFWTTDYLNSLAAIGIQVEVKGAYAPAFTKVSG